MALFVGTGYRRDREGVSLELRNHFSKLCLSFLFDLESLAYVLELSSCCRFVIGEAGSREPAVDQFRVASCRLKGLLSVWGSSNRDSSGIRRIEEQARR